MSRQTEDFFNEFSKFVEEKGGELSKDELDNLMNEFVAQYNNREIVNVTEESAESVYDFLELAENTEDEKEALKYAKKAQKLDPDNLDAASLVIELSTSDFDKGLEKYKKLIAAAEKKLEDEGYFAEENVGKFWLITETRPYMRLLYKYADILIQCTKMRLAAEVYSKMLTLCEGDNIGARYRLMSLYAFLEDEESAVELYKTYSEESVMILLPLSMLYYKLGDLRKSEKYLKKMNDVNKDTFKFFDGVMKDKLSKYLETENGFGYQPFTIEEFMEECRENFYLFASNPAYIEWAWKKLKNAKK